MNINIESVTQAAEKLIENGENPTLAGIRKTLGGGSFTTISPLFKQWRESQQKETAAPISDPTPEEIGAEVKAMASRIWQAAISLANGRLTVDREALEQTRAALHAERDEAAELADLVNADLEQVSAELESVKKSLEGTQTRLAESEKNANDKAKIIDEQTLIIKDAHTAAQTAQARADELAGLLSIEQAARTRVESEAGTLHERIETLTAKSATLQTQLDVAKGTSIECQSKLNNLTTELKNVNTRVETTTARLEAAARDIEKAERAQEIAHKTASEATERAARLEGRIIELEKQVAAKKETQATRINK